MKLCSPEECTGCLACYNICNNNAIEISTNEEGFVHPLVNLDKCIDCGLCSKVCPILNPYSKKNDEEIECYAAWNKDANIVRQSSSGGFFTTIASWVLQQQGVVYGSAFDKDFNIHHIRVDSECDLAKLKGSKYIQSFIGDTFKEVRNDINFNKWILFVGTPCQIDGLLRFLGKLSHYEQLITIDLVCHGVPSPLMFQEYKRFLESKYHSSLCAYEFRNKKWSWLHFNTKAVFSNGKKYIGTWEEDVFIRGFLREFFTRPSCHQCKYANKQRVSDFTIGDYWGYRHMLHEKNNEDMGISIVLAHTPKARTLLKKLEDKMYMYSRTLDEAILGNETFEAPFPKNLKRDDFWQDYRRLSYNELINKYLYPEPIPKDIRCLYRYGKCIYKGRLLIKRIFRKLRMLV